ncbi:Imm26 family immunity protein [Xylocopilactobacillus apis]|uniref:Immunity protein 26 n=1 Tax=Xylocopilactobacillus apis TaxID=2932183 RepID=A0AAU9DLP2_9LACO|nr:Imm26 family immunity protein [Xylocopilactobacillus apis]BDR55748.1 hypothetical protein KIMC2_03100 [Xylocopilactobacillus apis]
MEKIKVRPGEIYAIPLFLPTEDIKENLKNYKKEKFENRGREFAYCRIIKDKVGSGIFVEVFNKVGTLQEDFQSIINSCRLFPPISISGLGILKGRWKKIYTQRDYDPEKDSSLSKIQLVLGRGEDSRLWQNGIERKISEIEANNYEQWIVWTPTQLEIRLKNELFK